MSNAYAFVRPFAKACLCLAAISFTLSAPAQKYYPAGLGNGNLQLWLTAADPTTLLTAAGTQAASGDPIAVWKDKSGRGADASQDTAGYQPVYQPGALNGSGAVIFQNNTQYMIGPTGAYQTVVSTRTMLGTGYQYLFSSPSLTDFSVRFSEAASIVDYTQGPNDQDWDINTYDANYLPATWLNGVRTLWIYPALTHILVDEAASATNATYSISNTFLNRGMYNNDPVYDLIVYNGMPNNAQRVLLENYEASEWGLTGLLPDSNYAIFKPATSTTYNKNLVGIGNSGSDNFLADVPGSTDGFGFSSGSGASDFLGSTGYAMAAHNAQQNTVNYNPGLNNVPADSYVWNRSWDVQLSGGNSTGNITLTFNFKDYNGSAPNPADYFGLLYNPSDGTFASGTNTQVIAYSTSVSSNSVSFVVNATGVQNGYYTILYNQNNVLAIKLDDFTVTALSPGAALAKWAVGPGFGPGSFVVQRSADGKQFTSIGTVHADEDGENYSYVDNAPIQGIDYYRLIMTDAAGDVSYSPIRVLVFGGTSHPVTLFPVPTKDVLYISAPGINEARNIDLVAVSGQVLGSCFIPQLDGASLSVSRLAAGAYFVRITGGGQGQPIVLPFIKK